ncbi:pre-rRNA-processing protein esf1 [Rhizopus stolonifer]|uniref:Pre-rRNA-processing protein esf1 n=1 Tax=Rhizopus stolonifer TaxID=4846 RepID=A0A367JFZ2_RHIST|nr:pre-rRNA-processing protein esf1 [Rhizopus stolonifer]
MAPNDKKNFKKGEPKTPVTNDPRFSRVHNDPRFVRPKKKDMKVTIDKRFAGMMKSTDFSGGPRVDKYGRRLEQDTAEKELKRFYQLEEDEESDDYSDEDKTVEQLEKELAEDKDNLRFEKDSEESEKEDLETQKKFYDPMRGRGEISSDDDDDDTDASGNELDKVTHIPEGEETSRLALVNMDWDKIKAVDIMKVLNGFKPDTGVIQSVTIYPSEFGKERLKLEETQGPPTEIFKHKKSNDKGDGQDFDQEALRKYQLDRLKYYYAVIECDSPKTAKVIYKACDNTEYESSANFFDLRYIPENMTFDDEPRDSATVAPENYTPTKFQTDALRRTKVSLTWDEDDVDRYQAATRIQHLKTSEAAGALVKDKEEESKEETSIETYLPDMDEETANDPFFKEAMEEMEQEGVVTKKTKSKKRASKEEREEKARERAELELLMDDDGKGEGFNMKEVLKREKMEKKKKNRKNKKNQDLGEDDFEINVSDPRFAAVQESHHFAIDPTNPQFKKTKSMQKLLNARQQKMKEGSMAENDNWKKEKKSKETESGLGETKSKSSLQQLVASVKRKGALDNSKQGKRLKK